MKSTLAVALLTGSLAGPLYADGHASGDAAAGEKAFRQCKACHMIADADGNAIAKGGKTGPNLYGLAGRTAGAAEDFTRYRDSLVAAGEAGLVWDEEQFLAYVADPKAYLQSYLNDDSAKSGMSFKLRKDEDGLNIWAYIVSASE